MKTKDVAKLKPFDLFYYWIKEREGIRNRREQGYSKPWTDDEILRQYRFCNVRRMDDKVSQWLLEHWYIPDKNHPNMLAACAIARHFNLPAALIQITHLMFDTDIAGDHWHPEHIKKIMRERKAKGLNIFNGAYMVRGIGTADKTEMVVDKVVQPLIDNPPEITGDSMQYAVEALLPYWGFSLFMAGQVVADLRHAMEGKWEDKHIWAPMGPGSKRGMNRLHDRDKDKPLSQPEFLGSLAVIIQDGSKRVPEQITRRMEAIDWQNCLCEYDKYCRVLHGEGRPKQKYPGV